MPFVAYDEIADAISALPAGTVLECNGEIHVTTWGVGNHGTRERLEIKIESVETKGRATEQ